LEFSSLYRRKPSRESENAKKWEKLRGQSRIQDGDNFVLTALFSQGEAMMNANGERLEPPDLSHYEENRCKFPLEELAKYGGKHVAFSLDGKRIVASGATEEELEAALRSAGIHFSQVVFSYVDSPGVSRV
jgi:hypothetical protein